MSQAQGRQRRGGGAAPSGGRDPRRGGHGRGATPRLSMARSMCGRPRTSWSADGASTSSTSSSPSRSPRGWPRWPRCAAARRSPIAADESVRDVGTARALLRSGAADVLVIKPARVGGLRQARAIVELAEAAGVAVTSRRSSRPASVSRRHCSWRPRSVMTGPTGWPPPDCWSQTCCRDHSRSSRADGRAPGPGSGRAARRGRRRTVPGRMSARVPDWLMARASADPDGPRSRGLGSMDQPGARRRDRCARGCPGGAGRREGRGGARHSWLTTLQPSPSPRPPDGWVPCWCR